MWKFEFVPRNFWGKKQNRVEFLKWLEKQLRYKSPEDWYNVSVHDFRKHGGKVVIERGTMHEVLKELYPRYRWLPWKFNHVERGFWKVKSNRLWYMQWLGRQLGYKKMEDWYQLSKRDVNARHGARMLELIYGVVPYHAVADCFPEFDWKPWLFNSVPTGFWNKKKNRLFYLRWLGESLGFKKPDDWYLLTDPHFKANKGIGLLEHQYGGSPQAAVCVGPRLADSERLVNNLIGEGNEI